MQMHRPRQLLMPFKLLTQNHILSQHPDRREELLKLFPFRQAVLLPSVSLVIEVKQSVIGKDLFVEEVQGAH